MSENDLFHVRRADRRRSAVHIRAKNYKTSDCGKRRACARAPVSESPVDVPRDDVGCSRAVRISNVTLEGPLRCPNNDRVPRIRNHGQKWATIALHWSGTQLGNQSRDSRIRTGASETGLGYRSESEVDSNGREYHENIRT